MWPEQPLTANWGVPDPAAIQGTVEETERAYRERSARSTEESAYFSVCRWRASTGLR